MDKPNIEPLVDDFEISGIDFVDRYIRRNVWLYPETTSISSLPTLEFYKWNNGGDGFTSKDSNANGINLENPEMEAGHGKLYNEATNTLRFLFNNLDNDLLLNPSFIKKGDELKIPIEPRLLGETYYYLTLTNPTYDYNNGKITITTTPIYYIIDDVVVVATAVVGCGCCYFVLMLAGWCS
jgi:hypothetical protein